MVVARLLRLSLHLRLRASPRCAAETHSGEGERLMRMGCAAETRSERTSSLMRMGCAAETHSGEGERLMRMGYAAETRSETTSPREWGVTCPTS